MVLCRTHKHHCVIWCLCVDLKKELSDFVVLYFTRISGKIASRGMCRAALVIIVKLYFGRVVLNDFRAMLNTILKMLKLFILLFYLPSF